ncbi:MAG TPA: ABC transporter ATP-binding protein [Kofleriaceae bacterium]|nr:ABC transporter ATP-binding protein [Kofleriaceae bacterium]
MAAVLELKGLGRDYGTRAAVKALDLTIEKGEIFGLLGPNGAGKTTSISMACGVVAPSRGSVRVAGHDLATDGTAARRAIGLVPQELAIYEDLTPRQNLTYFGELYGAGAAAVDKALGIAELRDRADDLVKDLSGGMKRRLNLAAGLVHTPALLVCDEPTVGVDPQSRRHIFDSIKKLRHEGMTILYTTHYMEEVEVLCDRIAIMDAGEVIACGTLAELQARHASTGVELELEGDDATLDAAARAAGVTRDGAVLRLDMRPEWTSVISAIEATGARITEMRSRSANLETLFLALTGRSLRDA